MSSLFHFHQVWGYVAIAMNAIAGLVALAAWRWKQLRGKYVWICTVVAESALMLQVLYGVRIVSFNRFSTNLLGR